MTKQRKQTCAITWRATPEIAKMLTDQAAKEGEYQSTIMAKAVELYCKLRNDVELVKE